MKAGVLPQVSSVPGEAQIRTTANGPNSTTVRKSAETKMGAVTPTLASAVAFLALVQMPSIVVSAQKAVHMSSQAATHAAAVDAAAKMASCKTMQDVINSRNNVRLTRIVTPISTVIILGLVIAVVSSVQTSVMPLMTIAAHVSF